MDTPTSKSKPASVELDKVEEQSRRSGGGVSQTNLAVPYDGPDVPIYPSLKCRRGILAVLILSMFVDVVSSSAFFVFTGVVSRDLDVVFEQQSWIITSYTATFASFLLFWGRVSDLYSARPVFCYGFIVFGVLNIISSFLAEKYSLFIFRALAGVAGAALVPSAYRLIATQFPPEERGMAYTIYGMTGSIANVSGTIIAGVIALISTTGMLRNWRWFFRIMAALSLPAGVLSIYLIPKSNETYAAAGVEGARWKRMDPVGLLSMLSAVLLLIVALTMGATYGWTAPSFLAPIIISVVLFPFFFWWESRLSEDHALLPSTLWRLPNFTVLIVFGLIIYGWWAVGFVPLIEMFTVARGDTILTAALRTLPVGITAVSISIVMLVFPSIISHPRWPIIISMLLAGAALVLYTQAPDVIGTNYWRYIVPGMIIGSGGMQVALLATIVGVMLVAPPEKAGVIGATLQTAMHSGTVIALSLQAGLMTVEQGGIENFRTVHASWYFELGWVGVWLIGFVVFYRPKRNSTLKESDLPAEQA